MKIAQRVKLDRTFEDIQHSKEKDITGTIIGIGHIIRATQTQPVYIVELDETFFDPSKRIHVSCLTVARDNLFPI